jgi:uncharacterized protein (DUF1330 family)
MAAYLIADVEVTDPKGYEEYRQWVPALIAAHGGRYLARGGAVEVLEGDWMPRRTVILEFPSRDDLLAFYRDPAYQPLIKIRQAASNSRLVMIDGV